MTQYLTINGRTYNDDDISGANPTGLGAGGFKTLWNQFVGDMLADVAVGFQMSSATNLAIAVGVKVFTPATLRGVVVGGWIQAIKDAANYMWGQITAIDNVAKTITLNVTVAVGGGAYAAWTLQPTGPQGNAGLNGWSNYTFSAAAVVNAADRDVVIAKGATAQTVNLPAGPVQDQRVRVFHKNSGADVTVGRNGATIDGVAQDFLIPIAGSAGRGYEFYFDGATWQVFLIGAIATT